MVFSVVLFSCSSFLNLCQIQDRDTTQTLMSTKQHRVVLFICKLVLGTFKWLCVTIAWCSLVNVTTDNNVVAR